MRLALQVRLLAVSLLMLIMVSPIARGQALSPADVSLKDADVKQRAHHNWHNANTGGWGEMSVGTNINGMANTRRRAFIWFDADAVHSFAGNPTEVKLQLSYTISEGSAGTVNVFRVKEPWQEGEGMFHSGQVEPHAPSGVICWSRQPEYDSLKIMARYNFGRPAGGVGQAEIDISNLYQGWVSERYPNYGLVFVAANERQDRFKIDIHTSESSETDNRPKLLVSGGSGPEPGDQLTITYCDGSTQVVKLDQPSSNVASIGFPCAGSPDPGPGGGGPGGGGDSINLPVHLWSPLRNSEGTTRVSGNQMCVQSMRPGGAWFTTQRTYNFSREYTVELDFLLNETDNHYLVIYSDGFVSIDIDSGVDLGHIQPDDPRSLASGLANLDVNRWYSIRVEAQPWKGTFDLYLNDRRMSTARRLPSPPGFYHTASPQINDPGLIFFGDPDDSSNQGGRKNRGSACWRRIKVTIR
jgi:hypothetical protein